MMLKNTRFEDGWDDFPPTSDHLINQNPKNWTWRWIEPGQPMWSNDLAGGIPEMVHKHYQQLPPDEWSGESNSLFPDNLPHNDTYEYTYKVFHSVDSFGVEGWQVISGLKPGTKASVVVPVRIHANKDKGNAVDPYLAESGVWLLDNWQIDDRECIAVNGAGDWQPFTKLRQWSYIPGVKPDGWRWFRHGDPTDADVNDYPGARLIEVIVPESGEVCLLIRIKSKWQKPVDFFINDIHFIGESNGGTEPPEPPPDDDLEQRVSDLEKECSSMRVQIGVLTQQIRDLSNLAHEHDDPIEPPPIHPIAYKFEHGDLLTDVSKYNDNVNYQALADNGVKGAIVRATSGRRYSSTDDDGVDLRFWEHIEGCKTAGIPLGAYFFVTQEESIIEQVKRFNDTLLSAVARGYYFPLGAFYDVEGEFTVQTESELIDLSNKMLNMVSRDVFGDTTLHIDNKIIDQRRGTYSGAWWWNGVVPANATWPTDMNLMCWSAWYVSSSDALESLPSPDIKFGLMHGWDREDVSYWQFTSTGGLLVGQDDKSLDLNYTVNQNESSGVFVDILPFVKGRHRIQFDKEYKLSSGNTGTETVQIWHLSDVDWLHIKSNGQYWKLGLRQYQGTDHIFMYEDTSESETRWFAHYEFNGGEIGAPWLPRHMEVGKWYEFPKFVQHYLKHGFNNGVWSGSCTLANGGNVVDKIRLVSTPYNKTYDSGEVLEVITLEWAGGEQYDFAGGNVAFRNHYGDTYWFMQWLEGREDKFGEIIKPTCVELKW